MTSCLDCMTFSTILGIEHLNMNPPVTREDHVFPDYPRGSWLSLGEAGHIMVV